NSWITFTSDNGPLNLEGRSTNGLRGHKARFYEGGIREPTVMYWKGKIEGAKVVDEPLTFFDFVPTFYDMFGMKSMNNEPLDGESMLPAFDGISIERKTPPIWMGRWKTTVRKDEWKIIAKFEDYVPGTSFNDYLVHRKIATYELYNLKKDPYETKDLSMTNVDKLQEMKLLIEERVRSVQEEIVPWNGQSVLPYEVVKMYSPNVPPKNEFSKLSPEEQDLMKSAK
ncbi:MAG: sulfatase-like hydrolase/transferase, partial [Saprospiraceae bacterium]|nr:sulfatase-like hydrolase/transferase [Saprospiraceae bacterium]